MSSVTTMAYMFLGASAFNQPVGGWQTGAVTDMRWMFGDAVLFNQDLSSWELGAESWPTEQVFLSLPWLRLNEDCCGDQVGYGLYD